jgi:hypothetical protein
MIKSNNAKGPWTKPILVKSGKGLIDPTPLWDDNGKAYLIYAFAGSRAGIKSRLVACTMNSEGTFANSDEVLLIDGHQDEPTIEGPKIYKKNGYYFIFLVAVDLLAQDCLENRILKIQNTNFDFCVFTMQVFFKKVGDSISTWKPNSKKPLNDFLFHKLPWQTMQPIWKTDFIRSIGGFNQDFERMQDVELHTRALLIEHVLFKQIVEKPDCYYRIDEDRKIFNTFNFISLRIDSTILYVQRFNFLPMKQRKYLIGTIYETFLQLVYVLKKKQITRAEFEILKEKLFKQSMYLTKMQKILFYCSQFYNFNLYRVMGVNRFFKYLILI